MFLLFNNDLLTFILCHKFPKFEKIHGYTNLRISTKSKKDKLQKINRETYYNQIVDCESWRENSWKYQEKSHLLNTTYLTVRLSMSFSALPLQAGSQWVIHFKYGKENSIKYSKSNQSMLQKWGKN